jgi:hypothetical protein
MKFINVDQKVRHLFINYCENHVEVRRTRKPRTVVTMVRFIYANSGAPYPFNLDNDVSAASEFDAREWSALHIQHY